MPSCPVQDSPQQRSGSLFFPVEPLGQLKGFGFGEVAKLNAPPDIEGRRAGVLDQIRRAGDT